ncbi:MAG TPA: hypothetical protein VFB33_12845 [Candidatus Binataceae bacterium]|jgi:hypothetical protein|nr:hypothetical protein [Candidatus Binataceae bacterium]
MIGEPKRPLKEPAARRAQAELPAWFYRLSPRAQQVYLRSDAIDRFELAPSPSALALADALLAALEAGQLAATERAAQNLATELCRLLHVRSVPLQVKGVRPRNARGELHGIFFSRPPRIVLWMRTAQRHDVVKPKTFLRTLMHELGHYLDYALLRLGDSYHTRGFFKRESFLVRALWPAETGGD